MQRRQFNQLLSAAALGAVPGLASAQGAWPASSVRIIIGFGPGSGTDLISRMMAEELRQALGQPFVVDNRPGASAQIAASAVAKAPADGYTLMLTSNTTHSVNPHLFKKLPYDPIADFTPIGGVAQFPFILAVNASLPVRTAEELVTYAQQNKGKVAYAYGTPTVQIPMEAINRLKNMGALGVAYKSSPPALTDVVGGQAQFLVVDLASARPHLQSGRLRALAITSSKRSALAPDLPTVEEALGLRDFDLAAWTGMFGPAGLPREVVEKVSSALQRSLSRPDLRERITAMGAEPTPSDTATFTALVRRQLDLWGKNVALAGLQAE
jgi:tripartite-type tricarboxylate transporter receptor subunit TctC